MIAEDVAAAAAAAATNALGCFSHHVVAGRQRGRSSGSVQADLSLQRVYPVGKILQLDPAANR